jgi:hypothetical protein
MMLQTMQKKVEAEGEAEAELVKKFMCYCKTNKGSLTEAITAAEAKGPQVSSDIEEAEGEKGQLEADLKAHSADRDSAKASVAEATAIREKEAAAFADTKSELTTNINAISKAVSALENGMAGGFLQTGSALKLRKIIESRDMIDMDRQTVLSFLAGGQNSEYSPQSGEITGILKNIGDEMSKSLAEATSAEEASIKDHEDLVAAKTKEIAAHTTGIEKKTVRHGEVAVNIVNMKNDLSDTQAALLSDKAFLADLDEGCSTKEAEWTERQKTRAEELAALSETINFLNNDDALELFKKSVPTGEASFVQMNGRRSSNLRARALVSVRAAADMEHRPGIDLIAMALRGKTGTGGFEKVIAMIDNMKEILKKEQLDDDNKKEYCATQLDRADDKKKVLEGTASDEETSVASAKEAIATVTSELSALMAGVEELDKSVAEATEQRKKENSEYTELMALDSHAKELLGVAKNRLNKFYNPDLYIAPPKKELTQEEKIYQGVVGPSFVQISEHAAPPPPPETFDAYTKKGQETSGVIAMMDMLIKDLDKEMTEAQTAEKDAQKDYEKMLSDAKAKRAADSKSITEKQGTKATLEGEMQSHSEAQTAATKELVATAEYIHGLHVECDWLTENYDVRKSARSSEVESLMNAKAVLSGSDYSLVQLRGSRR